MLIIKIQTLCPMLIMYLIHSRCMASCSALKCLNTDHGEHLTTGGNGRKELPALEVSTINEAHITTGGNGKMDKPVP